MKKKILFLTAVLVCLSIAMTGTLAYFTADDVAHNVITTGKVSIELKEWADKEKQVVFQNLQGVMPGSTVTKIAEVKNSGSADAWVRAKVTKTVKAKNGNELSSEVLKLDIDRTDSKQEPKWILKDGYYYYQEALKAGETSEPIFRSVSFDKSMDNLYQGSTASVDVLVQAVQTANNGDSAENASGWPQNGSTVTP